MNDQLTGLFLEKPQTLAALPRHELFAAGEVSKSWSEHCPPFRYQGATTWCTAFAGTSLAYIFEKVQNGSSPLFSPVELFYRSGGSLNGNYLVNVGVALQETVVLEDRVPTPKSTLWNLEQYTKYKQDSKATAQHLEEGKKYRLKSFANVNPTPQALKAALSASPLFVALGIGKGYFDTIAPRQTQYNAYHAVLLTDIDENGVITIFDSLTQKQGFDGFHKLAPDYEILYALSFIDIPDNWKEIQKDQQVIVNQGALKQYGKPREIMKEQTTALRFSATIRQHPTLTGLVGRDWLIIVNALAYGGYSEQDILNHYTNIRRTGKPIFDLNKEKNRQ